VNLASRKVHRLLAPWLALPLVLTLLTGIVYRLGRAWFGMEKETAEQVIHIHTGEWLGESVGLPYVLVIGLSLLALVVTGTFLLCKGGFKKGPRLFHRILGAVLLIPLGLSAVTGILIMTGEAWFHWSKDTEELFFSLHQGSWLGRDVRPYYILFVGLGLLFLVWSGLQMILNRSRQQAA
jgi:hypothetical protein